MAAFKKAGQEWSSHSIPDQRLEPKEPSILIIVQSFPLLCSYHHLCYASFELLVQLKQQRADPGFPVGEANSLEGNAKPLFYTISQKPMKLFKEILVHKHNEAKECQCRSATDYISRPKLVNIYSHLLDQLTTRIR